MTASIKSDIQDQKDIRFLVIEFYNQALTDEVIGPVFKAANFSLDAHIPVMVRFWETILLDVVTYKGNPMLKHIALNHEVPLHAEHFERWMKIWEETIRAHYEGPVADQAISRASSIGQLMQYKIKQVTTANGL
ncbi:group III truncated hemoglobin [Pedobacter gandavensis]|uniref:group III truncated hemoglobin n=1 Tax=Pedobacter gandavensis TaxID=2679963 RepID=UPI00292CF1D6|nr:group III truncated hemoglobin [Pedobacter gandavensis]